MEVGRLDVSKKARVNEMDEYTLDNGILIETVELKDGLVEGRNVSTDGSKLDHIEDGADVTDRDNIASSIIGAPTKTTPANMDIFNMVEGMLFPASLRKITWLQIRNAIETYMNTIYAAIGHTLDSHGGNLSEEYGGTGKISYDEGDLLIGDDSDELLILPGGLDNQVLRMNGDAPNWEFLAAGMGDMLKSVYDTDDNGIVDVSETLFAPMGGNRTYTQISTEIDTDIATHTAISDAHHPEDDVIPYITTIDAFLIQPSTQDSFTLEGLNFKPDSVLSIPSWQGTIDSQTIVSPTQIDFTITAGVTETSYDIVVTNIVNNTEWTGNGENLISVQAFDWMDLRLGGTVFTHGNGAGNDIRYKNTMSLNRDADGIWFTGVNPWSSWVKVEVLGWTRGDLKTVEWVFSVNQAAFMIGIGSDATDENNAQQYRQAEVEAYFSSSTQLYGLYGNNGTPGSAGYQYNGQAHSETAMKIKFTSDGEAGIGVFTFYGLTSTSPVYWNDETNPIHSFTVGGTLAPDELNLMPFIIPRDGGAQRFTAVRVR